MLFIFCKTALEGGGLYRLQLPRDGGGAADARAQQGDRRGGQQRWRRRVVAGEGHTA
jgi:hypothetical protein